MSDRPTLPHGPQPTSEEDPRRPAYRTVSGLDDGFDDEATEQVGAIDRATLRDIERTDEYPSLQAMRELLGRYPVERVLGSGGMGEVLEVLDTNLGRHLAAKVLVEDDDPQLIDKFLLEAQVTGRLEHPGIVPVHELGRGPDGRVYFTMKRVEGEDLGARLDRRVDLHADLPELLRAFLRVCEAISFAHSRGVLHRDIKPSNVMLGRFGEVLVMDWGLARVEGWTEEWRDRGELHQALTIQGRIDRSPQQTQIGDVLGTPGYMPPEQAAGEIDLLDERADVYALGGILYEILCGKTPHRGETASEVIRAARRGQVVPPSRIVAGVPWELEGVAMRALRLERDERYARVEDLRADVQRWLDGRTLSVARYSLAQRMGKWVRRHRALTAVVLLLGLLVAGAAAWAYQHELAGQRVDALVQRARAEADAERWTRALVDGERALERRPADPAAMAVVARAREALQARELRAARSKEIERLVAPVLRRFDETRAAFHNELAVIDEVLVRLHRSVTYLEELAADDPESVRLQRLIGQGWGLLGNADRSLEAYRRVLELQPGDGDASLAIGRLYLTNFMALPRKTRRQTSAATQALTYFAAAEKAGLGTDLDRVFVHASVALASGKLRKAERLCVEGLAEHKEAPGCQALFAVLGWIDRRPDSPGRRWWELALERKPHDAFVLRLRAQWHQERGDLDAAIADSVRASRAAPYDADLWRDVGDILVSAERFADALQSYDRALRIRPEFASVYNNRGSALGQLGRHAEALRDFERTIALAPEMQVAHIGKAKALANLGRKAEAIATMTAALRLGEHLGARGLRGTWQYEQRRFRLALVDLDRVVAEEPGYRTIRGFARLALGDVEGALADARRVLARAPKDPSAMHLCAMASSALGRHDEALRLVRGAVERAASRDERARITTDYGVILMRAGELERALAAHDLALKLAPELVDAWVNRAAAHLSSGDLKRARADVDEALRREPTNAPALSNRASLRARAGDVAGAEEDYGAVIAAHPKHAMAFNNRGTLRLRAGRTDEALADFDAAVSLQPSKALFRYNRGLAHRVKRDYAAAEADFDAALQREPDHGSWLVLRGVCRRRLDRNAEALADFRRATTLAPKDWEAWLNLGLLLGLMGEKAEAEPALKTALTLAPAARHARIRDWLGQLKAAGKITR